MDSKDAFTVTPHRFADRSRPPVLLVTGPTASGKSGFALNVARAYRGTVINADSMQVYRELRVLSDRPTPADEAAVPHRLYGVLPASDPCTAERWRSWALDAVAEAHEAGRLPILVGGTGLYLRAFLRGLAPVPDIPADVRQRVRGLQHAAGPAGLRRALLSEDPTMAAHLAPDDGQRQARALEVVRATGRSLAAWQADAHPACRDYDVLTLATLPPRGPLYRKIDDRLAWMVEHGGLEEVQELLDQGLSADLPALKAVGVPQLARYLRGEMSYSDALAKAQQATRQFAKRQLTWLRTQTPKDADKAAIAYAQFSKSAQAFFFNEIRECILTAQP
ncbi:tRNA (adenosine(37)-N6)-dimethylallyltransferase MiaA [Rhodovibrio salinarum]|uniref:tRNA (adenosine(37)-N6)-dimethylallyltransferase MiaA n=1 Tax=Rhodovibrio salinarum TaxID=1087 RepID=UPI0004B21DF8|nr:tRNA (adenosine(37)-N6)-dimethylallyltransferase MiaA [Rhodovibrio salinarum]